MAATVSAWAKPGAWALDSEENEQELLHQHNKEEEERGERKLLDFHSLSVAATTKTKKKKGQTLSLGEFSTYSSVAKTSTYQAAKGLTTEDLMMLPTGPRQRTADELDRTRLGGGFRSYGSNDSNNESSNSRWGSNRDSDENRRGGFERRERGERELAPSRADEIDDWGAAKKSTIGGGGGFDRRERGERGERGGFFSDSHSRADESDSWVTNKSFAPSEGRKFNKFDSPRERRVGFESNGGADSSDNWGKKKEDEGRKFGSIGGAFDSLRDRRGGNELNGGGDSDNWGKKREEGSGGVRPKLSLQPRKLPVGESDNTVEVKPNKGSNPFGDARPREQVLKEKGKDWKEIDEKLELMKMKDADGQSFGKKSFGSFNGREDQTERSWRKDDSVDVRLPSAENRKNGVASAENSENGVTDEPEARESTDPQM